MDQVTKWISVKLDARTLRFATQPAAISFNLATSTCSDDQWNMLGTWQIFTSVFTTLHYGASRFELWCMFRRAAKQSRVQRSAAATLQQALSRMLIELGFWRARERRSDDTDPRPHPSDLIDDAWDAGDRRIVAEYCSRAGWLEGYEHGAATCRLCPATIGCCAFTQGTYVWPEGFSHYVAAHACRPPDDFIAIVKEAARLQFGTAVAASLDSACAWPIGHAFQYEETTPTGAHVTSPVPAATRAYLRAATQGYLG